MLEEHGKQLVESRSEKESLILYEKKYIFEEIANERMGEIQNLSKDINFNNLTYYFKGNSSPKIIIGFKGQLGFYKNIKEGYTILEKAEENKNNNKIRSK